MTHMTAIVWDIVKVPLQSGQYSFFIHILRRMDRGR